MNWILIAYLLALIFLSTRLRNADQVQSLRRAWLAFALIPFLNFTMDIFRIGGQTSMKSLQLIEMWEQALSSFLLGISLWRLADAIAPEWINPRDE